MLKEIKKGISDSISVKQAVLWDDALLENVEKAIKICIKAFRNDRKVLFCGNGGSAADAQHLAGELSGRFYLDREPLFAEALNSNVAFLTAVANDYGYEEVYSRMVKAAGGKHDVLFAISTSGNSPNIVQAVKTAKESKMTVIGMTGQSGGKIGRDCDVLLNIPSIDTPRIQEAHMLVGHLICEMVEAEIFGETEKDQKDKKLSEPKMKPLKLDKSFTLFLDRDGVINHRLPGAYISHWKDFKFFDGALKAIADFSKIFGRIVIVSNQQGLGRGLMTESQLIKVHQKMLKAINRVGGRIDGIYYCGRLASDPTNFRKPHPKMAFRAKKDFPEIDFNKSIIIGDSISDIVFGNRLDMTTVLIEGKTEEVGRRVMMETEGILKVDYRFNRLDEFAEFVSGN